jgi:hypothetical protein
MAQRRVLEWKKKEKVECDRQSTFCWNKPVRRVHVAPSEPLEPNLAGYSRATPGVTRFIPGMSPTFSWATMPHIIDITTHIRFTGAHGLMAGTLYNVEHVTQGFKLGLHPNMSLILVPCTSRVPSKMK